MWLNLLFFEFKSSSHGQNGVVGPKDKDMAAGFASSKIRVE